MDINKFLICTIMMNPIGIKEFIIRKSRRIVTHYTKNTEINFYVFGHRHLPLDIKIADDCRYINTGDWLTHNTYAVLDEGTLALKTYSK